MLALRTARAVWITLKTGSAFVFAWAAVATKEGLGVSLWKYKEGGGVPQIGA